VTDGRTDKVRTIALFSKGKFAKNKIIRFGTVEEIALHF
jgi:hypothetical protein